MIMSLLCRFVHAGLFIQKYEIIKHQADADEMASDHLRLRLPFANGKLYFITLYFPTTTCAPVLLSFLYAWHNHGSDRPVFVAH